MEILPEISQIRKSYSDVVDQPREGGVSDGMDDIELHHPMQEG